jgi:hypothetical protein
LPSGDLASSKDAVFTIGNFYPDEEFYKGRMQNNSNEIMHFWRCTSGGIMTYGFKIPDVS